MNKTIAIVIGFALLGGGSFYAGMKYGQNAGAQVALAQRAQRANAFGGIGTGQRGRGNQGGGFFGGTVLSKDDKSVTLKLNDGSSKIIFFSDTTKIMKSVDGVSADMTIGEQISVNGTPNQDGSISAQSIQIRPNFPQQNR
ncbi:MAG: hypothetical protein Q7R75_01395 [bacterium]|nr:hypothetical protein [bacterium]